MNLPDKIKTIDNFKESIFKENKSTFIAQVYSVISKEQAEDYISKSKKKYYDASHHCYAFKLTDGTTRYSDAGEPAGTAGIRIFNAIEHYDLLNQLVVVIRYFGGIKLGVGPLGRAYYTAACKVLSESEIRFKTLFQKIIIESEMKFVSKLQRLLSNKNIIILKSEFLKSAEYECLAEAKKIESIKQKLEEIDRNSIKLKLTGEYVYK